VEIGFDVKVLVALHNIVVHNSFHAAVQQSGAARSPILGAGHEPI
jgi:hypothetical protein